LLPLYGEIKITKNLTVCRSDNTTHNLLKNDFTVRLLPCNDCECVASAWDELDQRVIDTAVEQWRTHLHACVKEKGGYFEHSLP